jgi:hypothetical protein
MSVALVHSDMKLSQKKVNAKNCERLIGGTYYWINPKGVHPGPLLGQHACPLTASLGATNCQLELAWPSSPFHHLAGLPVCFIDVLDEPLATTVYDHDEIS